jgi:hypothetical protein
MRVLLKVFQFMAAKAATINIALAESSAAVAKANKEDSSSMKTIAVLGMFFLPGAFVAVSSHHHTEKTSITAAVHMS